MRRILPALFLVCALTGCGRDSNFNGTYIGTDQTNRFGTTASGQVTITLTQNGNTVNGTFIEAGAAGSNGSMTGTITGTNSGSTLTQVTVTVSPGFQSACATPLIGTGTQVGGILTLTLSGCGGSDTMTLKKQ